MPADPVSNWFEAQGVSPIVGGALLGASLVYLILRNRKPRSAAFQIPRVEPSRPSASVPGDLKQQALELVRAGSKIEAIKLVRQHEKLGLKEAKDLVEEWEREART